MTVEPPRKFILFVDDDEAMRAALYYALSPKYLVRLAVDGLDGYARANEEPAPDLIIADIVMPLLDGIAMARRLREKEALRLVPILFFTGHPLPKSLVEGQLVSHPFACLPKSVHRLVLQRSVERALGGPGLA